MNTDPIADMLTRIRNANRQGHKSVDIPSSKIKMNIAKLLCDEGYIDKYEVIGDSVAKIIRIYLRDDMKVINGLKRISKPGLRVYSGCDKLPKVLNGLGIAIISSNQGIITDKQARKLKIGGEVLAFVW